MKAEEKELIRCYIEDELEYREIPRFEPIKKVEKEHADLPRFKE
jgi:hypothetical protein